jgi:hypothetical protein
LLYHSVVNPRHSETLPESLKEKTTNTTMGAHRKKYDTSGDMSMMPRPK